MPIKSRNLPPNLISGADALRHPVMLAAEKRAREEQRELQDAYVEECRRAAASDPYGNFEKAVKASDWPHPTREALLVGKLRDKTLPFLVRRDGERVEGDPDSDLGTLAAILRVLIRRDQFYEVFGGPVTPTAGTVVVADAPAHRRLTIKQKRELIGKLLEADPTKSDREIGRLTKTDGKTVASVRKEKEGREEIPHVATRTDTRGREQAAAKPKPKPPAKQAPPERRRGKRAPAELAAVAEWPPNGIPPPELSPAEVRERVRARLKTVGVKHETSDDTIDRATGLRKD